MISTGQPKDMFVEECSRNVLLRQGVMQQPVRGALGQPAVRHGQGLVELPVVHQELHHVPERLGVLPHDPGGTVQPLPAVRALHREPGPLEDRHQLPHRGV